MENENKDFQTSAEEQELQEKVRQDVSEKIAEAAAELQDEIDSAEVLPEDAEWEENQEAEEFADEDFEAEEWEEEPVKEPKKVTLKLSSLILSLVGTAVLGALLLLGGMQLPGWLETIPEGKTIATVDGTEITDKDMGYFLYAAAYEYFQANAEDEASLSEFDWTKEVDGKTAEEIVKENALDMAVEEVVLMQAGKKFGADFDAKEARAQAKAQLDQMVASYGEELVVLNAKRQGVDSIKQYTRKVMQMMEIQAVDADMQANPANYYPEDKSVLEKHASDKEATYKQILIAKDTALEGDEATADAEAKRAIAEEALARAKNGEDFDALVKEVGKDPMQPEDGYTATNNTAFPDEVEKAVFALEINGISEIVETEDGFHIIKRTVGQPELRQYWKNEAKVKVKKGAWKKMTLKQVIDSVDEATKGFEELYAQMQGQ
ncbi:MAG: peptidylprolyl isomerase [Clostridia bacterium]|nr:peptidylprolyl isomerase [Clostridia bacterium]